VVNANGKQMKVKWEKSYNENDYHTRNLTLTLNCVEKTNKTILLFKALSIPTLFTVNAENVVLDS
jgi:hypothetical protein